MNVLAERSRVVRKRRVTAEEYCAHLVRTLQGKQISRIPLNSPDVSNALGQIVRELHGQARQAYEVGDMELGDQLAEVIEILSPNPCTGAFDGFWTTLRALQPAFVGVENPLYPSMGVKTGAVFAGAGWRKPPREWDGLVERSAQILAKAV